MNGDLKKDGNLVEHHWLDGLEGIRKGKEQQTLLGTCPFSLHAVDSGWL